MPYIKPEDREEIKDVLEPLKDFIFDEQLGAQPGTLNYIITSLCHAYIQGNGYHNYAGFNEVIGVLECAKIEFYRMVAAKYENKKRADNGHISSLDESIV